MVVFLHALVGDAVFVDEGFDAGEEAEDDGLAGHFGGDFTGEMEPGGGPAWSEAEAEVDGLVFLFDGLLVGDGVGGLEEGDFEWGGGAIDGGFEGVFVEAFDTGTGKAGMFEQRRTCKKGVNGQIG